MIDLATIIGFALEGAFLTWLVLGLVLSVCPVCNRLHINVVYRAKCSKCKIFGDFRK